MHAVMLLTVSLGKSDRSAVKSLSRAEWTRFSKWLKEHHLVPSDLLKGDLNDRLSGWTDRSMALSRIEGLLDRATALGFALEKWERAGLWVISQSDAEYPTSVKRRLGGASPPVLFGCGRKTLLGQGGIAVVGSREADDEDIAFARRLGEDAAQQGFSIVSGGARGVDQSAMSGALEKEGTAIGVVANSLIRAATSAKYRKYLRSDNLVLISPYNPEAGFNVGNAMARNRDIYCLSDAAVAVASVENKGGTWNGAKDNLRKSWVPLWVRQTNCPKSGNRALVQMGANYFPENLESLEFLINGSPEKSAESAVPELPAGSADEVHDTATKHAAGSVEAQPPDSASAESQMDTEDTDAAVSEDRSNRADDFYELFLEKLREVTGELDLESSEIASRLNLRKTQVDAWLKRGVRDGQIARLTRPVRYRSSEGEQQKSFTFDAPVK